MFHFFCGQTESCTIRLWDLSIAHRISQETNVVVNNQSANSKIFLLLFDWMLTMTTFVPCSICHPLAISCSVIPAHPTVQTKYPRQTRQREVLVSSHCELRSHAAEFVFGWGLIKATVRNCFCHFIKLMKTNKVVQWVREIAIRGRM